MSYLFYRGCPSSKSGKVVAEGYKYASASSDAGADTPTSSGVVVDNAGGVILALTASTVGCAYNIAEDQPTSSLTTTGPVLPSIAPSVTSKNPAAPVDLEAILKHEFDNLAIPEEA